MTTVVSLAPFIGSAGAPQAGHLFAHHHLQALAEHAEVVLVSTALWGNESALARGTRSYEVLLTEELPIDHRGRFHLKRFAGDPDHTIRPPSLAGEVTDLVRRADVVELQWSAALALVPLVRALNPAAVVTVVEHDVVFTQLEGHISQAAGLRRWAMHAQWLRQRQRETSYLRQVDTVCVFRSEDAAALRARLPSSTEVITHSPWLEPSRGLGPSAAQEVLFVAAFNRPENQQAVRWFASQVWPVVVASRPEATFTAAGAGMSEELTQWLNARRIATTGYVDSLEPYYERARVAVAPLHLGGGLKFKVAQAMLAGLPVVGTPEAFAGIDLGAYRDLEQTDPAGTADQIIRLLADLDLARAIGAGCRVLAQRQFSFESSHRALVHSWERAATRQRSVATSRGR